jgi:hypothetical protein
VLLPTGWTSGRQQRHLTLTQIVRVQITIRRFQVVLNFPDCEGVSDDHDHESFINIASIRSATSAAEAGEQKAAQLLLLKYHQAHHGEVCSRQRP